MAFTNKIWTQEGEETFSGYGAAVKMMEDLQLDKMLAELREGSVEYNE